jgi:hypothetical protein
MHAQPIVIKEVINGRPCAIEVRPVGRDRWRAQLARRGTPTALMPFYGPTPAEAARQLAVWLSRAARPPHAETVTATVPC